MGRIHLLPPHEALKIAAGEVIDRPAHVIKELIENSIDAGATTITVFIEDVGKQLIRVVDDGCGMSEDDAELCFASHATSKLWCVDDLEQIASYGFRGEALASVAAISKVKLITKQNTADPGAPGIVIDYSGVTLQQRGVIACGVGTDVQIRDLFFNTPVRKKFLKRDETEWNALQTVFTAFCLSHPKIHFKLYRDGSCVINAPGVAHERERALQLWETDIAHGLLPLQNNQQMQDATISIIGSISHQHVWRYGRHHMYFFVNGRWVKNNEVAKALIKGYSGVLPEACFPAAVIFITMDRKLVDVNIHPKKDEVRFTHPGRLQTALTTAVKYTLEQQVMRTLRPASTPLSQPPISMMHESSIASVPKITPSQFFTSLPSVFPSVSYSDVTPVVHVQTKAAQVQPSSIIVGQLFATYLIIEKDDAIIFIDQHAAHERILYEKMKQNYSVQHGVTLLFPEIIDLAPEQRDGLFEHKDFFNQQGIDFDILSDEKIVVRSAPPQLKNTMLAEFIREVATFIHEHATLDRNLLGTTLNEHLHAQLACKTAIKAGDVLSHEQMKKLIDDLELVDNRFICVHGRPTMWRVEKCEFEKKFRRT